MVKVELMMLTLSEFPREETEGRPFNPNMQLCRQTQESVMNARGENCLFHDVVNQTQKYNNNQYFADNHLIIIWVSIPKVSITGGEIKNNINVHFPRATGSGLRLVNVHCTFQDHPC